MSASISRDRTPESATSQLVPDEPPPAASDVLLTEAMELPAGSLLGNYLVEACIGRGAMASVYRAEHRVLNKRVALKVMASSLHASGEARQRFLREARAVAAIHHPNVVSISDAGLMGGTPYLVMELLEGEDLEQHLERRGPFSGQALAALALPIVAALAAAHDAGVIHRDLKPGNIFLSRTPEGQLVPKLLDFGISKFASASGPANLAMTAFDQLMGSPLYLPPESLQGSRELTARSDQYSLGVVLYECLTGQAPFFREGLVPLLNAIVDGSCPAPRSLRPETPPALDAAVRRAMSVDPRQRFEHIRELGRALLPVADLRSQHIWAPVFAPESALLPAFGADNVTAIDTASAGAGASSIGSCGVRAAAPRAARALAALSAGRRWRVRGALALLLTGSTLLGLAIAHVRAQEPAARVTVRELEVSQVGQAASPLDQGLAAPLGSTLSASFAEPGRKQPEVAASAAQPRPAAAASSGRLARTPSHRARGSDSDSELSKLFFSGAASDGAKPAGPRRERAGRRAGREERSAVSTNEAPLFD